MQEGVEDPATAFMTHCAQQAQHQEHNTHLVPVAGDLCFDPTCGILFGAKGEAQLTSNERQLFHLLLVAHGRPMRVDTLTTRIPDAAHDELAVKSVYNLVSSLRAHLARVSSHVTIDMRRGFGYRLVISTTP